MIQAAIKLLTPFIIIVSDFINGVLLYNQYIAKEYVDETWYTLLSHTTGSSVLTISYIIVRSNHLCKYYKSSCAILLFMHIFSIVYVYTPISLIEYIYAMWVLCGISFVLLTIAILGRNTYKTIHQACIREQTE